MRDIKGRVVRTADNALRVNIVFVCVSVYTNNCQLREQKKSPTTNGLHVYINL